MFYFRLIGQPYFMLDLRYNGTDAARMEAALRGPELKSPKKTRKEESEDIAEESTTDPKITKYFAPLFDQYRAANRDMRLSLIKPASGVMLPSEFASTQVAPMIAAGKAESAVSPIAGMAALKAGAYEKSMISRLITT